MRHSMRRSLEDELRRSEPGSANVATQKGVKSHGSWERTLLESESPPISGLSKDNIKA